MEVLKINCGNFASLDNFYQSVGLSFQKANEKIYNKIELDCSLLNRTKSIRISVLTSLLSLALDVKKTYNIIPHIILGTDTSIFQFFKDINFYIVSKSDNVINWEDYETHSNLQLIQVRDINSKIISFLDLEDIGQKLKDYREIVQAKNYLQDIIPSKIFSEFSSILSSKIPKHIDRVLRYILSKTISEYVINSIIHGRSNSYLGLQISNWGISVCISDSGIGILNSLQHNYNSDWVKRVKIDNDINAIMNASLKQNLDIGLRDAIHTIIDNGGFTVISSGNAEIIWGHTGWREALDAFDHDNYQQILQDYKSILKYPLKGFYTTDELKEIGGYKSFNFSLKGTRVYFEIPFSE